MPELHGIGDMCMNAMQISDHIPMFEDRAHRLDSAMGPNS